MAEVALNCPLVPHFNSMPAPALTDFSQLQSWLVANPDALEPGLVLHDKQLYLGPDLTIPVYGTDPFGRPCLCMIHPTLDSAVSDKMLEVVSRLQTEGRRFRPLLALPSEPRIFLITSEISSEHRHRLDLLAGAFPLRTYLVSDALPGEVTPNLHLEDPLSRRGPHSLLEQLPPATLARVERLISAAEALQPPILLQGHDWPIVFVNQSGSIAALFADEKGLTFTRPHSSQGNAGLRLENDEIVDSAIDYLMRCQINSEPAVAQSVTIE